jgi:asparagine synthase (glutamine-hydrolysing)
MLSAMEHRGPDHFGGYLQDNVALGSARLSIVDLAGGAQPAVSQDRKVALAFNGEIYNYRSLRSALQAKGISFKTNSEVETLLYLYLDHGPSMFELLNGQFAVSIWDGRNDSLVLARDRVGIRPLFWCQSDDGLFYGSEVKVLMAHPSFQARLNAASLVQTFRFWTNVGETSAFEGVQQIPPGHFSVFKGGKVDLQRYWQWPLPETLEPLMLGSDEEYFESFREKLDESIERQRMADVTVGSYLSGGVDSSVIATSLKRLVGDDNLKTYSVTFVDPEYDESEAQNIVVKHCDLSHSALEIKSKDIGEVFPNVVRHAETPLFRTAPAPLYLLSKHVHEDGLKVVMTGEGADEVLLGYDLFRETLIRRFWSREPDSNCRPMLMQRLYHYLPQYRNKRFLNLLLDFYRPTLTDDGDKHYAMKVRWENGRALEQYFSKDMKAFADGYDPVGALDPWLPKGYDKTDDITRAQSVEASTLLGNYLLSSQGDRMSMAHSVEGRYPFLDHTFIEYAARLPRSIKLRGLNDKFIMRKAYAHQMPEASSNRPKVAYQAPDMKGFMIDGKAPDYVEELMCPARIKDVGLFDDERVTQLMEKARTFNLSRVGTRDNMAFVLILSTMLLDDHFVRNRNAMLMAPVSSIPLQLA